jgi:Na+-driven multidrug efflux pump
MASPPQKTDYPPRSDVPVQPQARTRHSAIGDGFEAGAIGALVVALWFLLIDTLEGRPFYTPSLLGTAITRGPEEAIRSGGVAVGMVYAYTGIHFVLFILFGIVVARLVIAYERTPIIGYLLVVAGVVFELGFLLFILAFAKPLLQEIPWWAVLAGNLLAALAMGAYFVKRHPELKEINLPVD